MSKIDLIRYKALERGWSKRDYQRVYKKIVELQKDLGESIQFREVEELSMMLDEAIDYKLEFSILRLVQEEKIFFNRLSDGSHEIIVRKF